MTEPGPADRRRSAPREPDPRRIVVVGPCASGKSALVAALRERAYDAHVSGQEHSEIATLWQRLHPDILVSLEVDIEAVRARRGRSWPEWLHDRQVARLQAASAAADLTIDTTDIDVPTMVERTITFLQRFDR